MYIKSSYTFIITTWQCKMKMSWHHNISRANTGTEAASHFIGPWLTMINCCLVQHTSYPVQRTRVYEFSQLYSSLTSRGTYLSLESIKLKASHLGSSFLAFICTWIPLLWFAPDLSLLVLPQCSSTHLQNKSAFSFSTRYILFQQCQEGTGFLSGHKSSQLSVKNPRITSFHEKCKIHQRNSFNGLFYKALWDFFFRVSLLRAQDLCPLYKLHSYSQEN